MFGRSVLVQASAAASLAAVLFAVTGCKIQVSAAAPGGASTAGAVRAASPGVTRAGSLIVEPGAGFSPVYGLINAARHTIDVTMYEFSDMTAEHDRAYARLAGAGIHISYYGSPAGFYIHGKVIEADYGTSRARIFIGSENFSGTSLNDNRELGLIISDHSVMSAIASTFASDFRNGQHWS